MTEPTMTKVILYATYAMYDEPRRVITEKYLKKQWSSLENIMYWAKCYLQKNGHARGQFIDIYYRGEPMSQQAELFLKDDTWYLRPCQLANGVAHFQEPIALTEPLEVYPN